MNNSMINNMKGALAEKRAALWLGMHIRKQYIAMPTQKWGKLDKMGIDILIRDISQRGKVVCTIQVKSSTHGADSYSGAAQYMIVAPEGDEDSNAMPDPYFYSKGDKFISLFGGK